MSFIAGRLAAGKEGAYFLQESKHAVGRLVEKSKPKLPSPSSPPTTSASASTAETEGRADVLPEVFRHSLPSRMFLPLSDSSLSTASKWALHSDPNRLPSASPDVLDPLSAYLSLPQVTFGPKRWALPSVENSVSASTANDLRHDKYTPVNANKLKAAAVGLSQIAKAFAIATGIVFGGASLMLGLAAHKLEIHNSDDIRTKGKDLVKPKIETFREQLTPLRNWAEELSRKWHLEREEDLKNKPLIKELYKMLGSKSTS